jgi:DNA repair exonuclease SbcCD nuclease subunit
VRFAAHAPQQGTIMRLIHFSDTHLGFAESSKVDPATQINVREQDAYAAFNAIIEQAVALKPDLVIHAGDLFHSARPSNRAITTAAVGFRRLGSAGIPLVLIAGNHSVPRVATAGCIFDVWQVLPGIYSAHRGQYEVLEIGAAAIHCVPHVATEAALAAELGKVQPRLDKRFNVLVMHGAVRRAGEAGAAMEFNEVVVEQERLGRFAGFDYVALGHYHRRLQVAPNAHYSGSPERFHVDEAGYEKGFLEVDLEAHKPTFHAVATRAIVKLPLINCRGQAFEDILDAVRAGLVKHGGAPGAIVVVRLEDIDVVNLTAVRAKRRTLEKECVPAAFEVRWVHSLAERRAGPGKAVGIGSLAAEFSAFMKSAKTEGLDKTRLQRLGGEYLAQAEGEEVKQ